MGIRDNKYSDPALGAAFENIASIFAPPSAQDMAGLATARAKKEDADRLSWLFANPNDPTASAKSALVGVQGYGQTPAGFQATDATNRYGIDTTAATSLRNNALDNETARYGVDRTYDATTRGQDVTASTSRANNNETARFGIAEQFMTPVAPGEIMPGLPASIADQFGVPEMPRVEGAPKPLSETELKAQERAGLRDRGLLTDDILMQGILGERTPVQAVGPNGRPVYMSPGEAVQSGAPAYVNPGSKAAPENGMAVLSDGSQVPAIQDANTGRWKAAQTGADLPADIKVFKTPAPTGSNEQLGVGTVANNNIERQLIDLSVAEDTAHTLRDLVAKSPASQGAVGYLRGTAQNLVQTSGELGKFFGGAAEDLNNMIASGAADANLAGMFDPNLPATEFLSNLFTFQYAKTILGERLSNESLARARELLGVGNFTANQADTLARIDTALSRIAAQRDTLSGIRANGFGARQPAGAPAAAPAGAPSAAMPQATGAAPQTSARRRYNENGELVQ